MCPYECGIVLLKIHDWCMCSYYVQKLRSMLKYQVIMHGCILIVCMYQTRLSNQPQKWHQEVIQAWGDQGSTPTLHNIFIWLSRFTKT